MSSKYFVKPQPPGNWRIVGATILERPPLILADAAEWEAPFKAWKEKMDEADRAAKGGAGPKPTDSLIHTYLDRLHSRVVDLAGGEDPRVTEADRRNNTKSLRRALAHRLFLVVKKDRQEHSWQFPQGVWQPGETIRDTAHHRLTEMLGDKLEMFYVSNAPAVHVEYLNSPEYAKTTGYYGTKIFFLRAIQTGGALKLPPGIVDFAWLKLDELEERISPNVWQRVRHALTQ